MLVRVSLTHRLRFGGRDEHYSLAGFLRGTPGNDGLQVCPRLAQSSPQLREAAGSVLDGRRPNVHTFHEKIDYRFSFIFTVAP